MENNEFLKKMLGEISKNVPAKIVVECDKNGKTHASLDGRGIDMLMLSIFLVESIIKKLPMMTIDRYCELLKDVANEKEKSEKLSKEERDVRNELMREFMEYLKNR